VLGLGYITLMYELTQQLRKNTERLPKSADLF
jgi:hypothetical protein